MVFSKASGVNDSIFGKSQEPIRAFVEERIEAFEKTKSVLKDVFVVEQTNKPMEKLTYETALQNFEAVGEGGNYPETEMMEGYSKVLEPDTWKSQFEVTMEMVEDANMGKVKQRAGVFSTSYGRTRESFGAAMLMGGLTGSAKFGTKTFNAKTADGQNLFSTGHPSKTGKRGVQSNLYDGALTYDNLCYAQEYMQNLTDDDGNILGVVPDTIVIPNLAALKKAAFNAVGADGGEPGTDTHGFNFQYGLWNIIVWPYLNTHMPSGSAPWMLMDSEYNKAYYGAVWLDRIPLSVRSEIEKNDNNVWKGRARYIAGFNDWRPFLCAYASSGGTAFPS